MNGTLKSEKFESTSKISEMNTQLCSRKRARTSDKANECKEASYQHDTLGHIIRLSNCLIVPRQPKRHLSDMMYIEHYENGGGYALHAYASELAHLSSDELSMLVQKFFRTLFTERRKRNVCVPFSYYCIGVIHGAAKQMPEFLSYLSINYPDLIVTTSSLKKKHSDHTTTISDYAKNVFESYAGGIYRYGPLHSLSLVGVKGEERGKYFQDILKIIEMDPFLNCVTPWGQLSNLYGMDPSLSDDGPILWCRHGEQTVPMFLKTPAYKKSVGGGSDVIDLLISRRTMKGRQILVNDRTPCHADHADDGLGRHTTAAVGLLKAVIPPKKSNLTANNQSDGSENTKSNYYSRTNYCDRPSRIIKDVVVFDPRHYPDLVERLQLDIMEPPATQCGNFWADDGELNQLHAEGFRYVRLPLRDNDIYFIPRNVVHQFKTVSAGTSIAWHVRLKNYYEQVENKKSNNTSNNNNNSKNYATSSPGACSDDCETKSDANTSAVLTQSSVSIQSKTIDNGIAADKKSLISQLPVSTEIKSDHSDLQVIEASVYHLNNVS